PAPAGEPGEDERESGRDADHLDVDHADDGAHHRRGPPDGGAHERDHGDGTGLPASVVRGLQRLRHAAADTRATDDNPAADDDDHSAAYAADDDHVDDGPRQRRVDWWPQPRRRALEGRSDWAAPPLS